VCSVKTGKVEDGKSSRTLRGREKEWQRTRSPKPRRRRRRKMAARKEKEKQVASQALVRRQFGSLDENGERAWEGEPEERGEILTISKFVTEPAQVKVEYGLTINLGNYESAKVGVAVSVPCYFEELEAAYKWAAKWAEDRVLKEQDQIRKSLQDRAEEAF
jgi:hypothetical protein